MKKGLKRSLVRDLREKIGETVMIKGWVDSVRDHGKIIFIDLRDRSGMVQCVGAGLERVTPESVLQIEGLVKERPEKLINPKLETGKIELEIKKLKILSLAEELPLPLDTDGKEIDEEIRLKYRYLDLRRKRLQRNIRLRSKFVAAIREYLYKRDFVEIETPLLTQSTPEGARDFLVPARLQPGKFYALPQSPQQYKQLLMTAGFERYFQIAKCLRDEDLRADRGFEHTQLDLEMSFVNQKQVMAMIEGVIIHAMEKCGGKIKEKPFPVVSYQEAIDKHGSDKFDLRSAEDKKNKVLAFAWVVDFPFFERDKKGNWTYTHNPFSDPKTDGDKEKLRQGEIEEVITSQYDLVCNGYEVGGGSIRANDPELLTKVFEVLGYSKEKIEAEFGHMLKAFKMGMPPHGGCAPGIDRLMMVLTGETSMKEVVAFPQTSSGRTAVMQAPSEIEEEQLKELKIKVVNK